MRTRIRAALGSLSGFEAAARQLSFTRAAFELNLTQSAISRQIAGLEEAIGTSLFVRHNRRLALTPAGEKLAYSVRTVLRELEQALEQIKPSIAQNQVTISTTVSFASLWLVPRLADFRQQFPGIDVRISADDAIVDLRRQDIDLAIRFARPEVAPAGALALFGEWVMPVCAPALTRRPVAPLRRPEDLRDHVLLHFDNIQIAPWLDWRQWCSSNGLDKLKPAGNLSFSHYDQLINAAIAGEGVALGRLPLIERSMKNRKLVAPFKGRAAIARKYYLLRNDSSGARGAADAFVAWLTATTQLPADY